MKMGSFEKRFVNSPAHSRRVSRRVARLVAHAAPRPGQRYLEIGCGNGAAAVHVARTYGLHVTGVDVDPEQVEAARARASDLDHARFMTVDGANLPFDDAAFDIVASFKTTHHIPDWENAVEEMVRALKPRGHFVYSDFVVSPWLARLGVLLRIRDLRAPIKPRIEAVFDRHRLIGKFESRVLLSYSVVLEKPDR